MKRPASFGWTLAGILFILYLLVKVQGWGYGFQVARLERQLRQLRPSLSVMVLADQMKLTKKIYAKAFDQICQMDIEGSILLQQISEQIPPSVRLEKLELDPQMGLKIQGTVKSTGAPPEAILLPWAQKLQAHGENLRIHQLAPESAAAGLWRFELRMTEFHCA